MRIQIYDYENDVVPRRGHLAVKQNGVVLGVVEPQIRIKLEGAVLFPDFVYSRDPVFDVSRRVPIALLELIFLGIETFLATRQSLVLAQFVTRSEEHTSELQSQ